MITIQIPEPRHTADIQRFIDVNRLTLDPEIKSDESMIFIDDGNILGYGTYRRRGHEGVVTLLFIEPSMRKMSFGDGLFRGLLNLMERNGITHFYVPTDETWKGFLIAEELTPCTEKPEWAQSTLVDPLWFEGTLPEFFMKPCKGGGHSHDSIHNE